METHLGPIQLTECVTFSQRLSDRVWCETGARASYRSRSQWRVGRFLTLDGPVVGLLEALDFVKRYGSVRDDETTARASSDDALGDGGVEAESKRVVPEGRAAAGARSKADHGTPKGRGGAGTQW